MDLSPLFSVSFSKLLIDVTNQLLSFDSTAPTNSGARSGLARNLAWFVGACLGTLSGTDAQGHCLNGSELDRWIKDCVARWGACSDVVEGLVQLLQSRSKLKAELRPRFDLSHDTLEITSLAS